MLLSLSNSPMKYMIFLALIGRGVREGEALPLFKKVADTICTSHNNKYKLISITEPVKIHTSNSKTRFSQFKGKIIHI